MDNETTKNSETEVTEQSEMTAEDGAEEEQEPQEQKNLYQQELDRYRATLKLGHDVSFERYGCTMVYSISPEEYIRYRQEMGFVPQTAVDYYNLGNVAAEEEDWKKAVKYYEQCLTLDKNFLPALFNLGVVGEQTGDLKKAKDCYCAYADQFEALEDHPDFRVGTPEDRQAEAESLRSHAENLGKE